MARMPKPSRLSSLISSTSFPLNISPILCFPESGVLSPSGVGDFSTGTMGIFAPALTQKDRIAARLCVVRKSEAAIERAHRRIALKQARQKLHDTPEARELACYVMVLTTLGPQQASSRQVMECYRLRWQIELTFKRLKSIVQMGHVPKQDDASSRAWLYGKLFVALLTEKLARVGSAISPWGY